jgi:outer membrane lipoprotein SlyB
MKKTLLMAVSAMIMLNACKANIGANDYDTYDVGVINRAFKCTILTVREIDVKSAAATGAIAGASAGAIGGGAAGAGGGDAAVAAVAAIGGAVVGGVAGAVAQDGLTAQKGYEYIVEKDDGELAALAQGDDVRMEPGERCIIMYGSRRNRIVPFPEIPNKK